MNKRQPPSNNRELVDALADLFEETGLEEPSEIDETLREAGYDPDVVGSRFKEIADRAIAESPANWRNKARQEIDEEKMRLAAFKPSLSGDRVSLIEAIQGLLASRQTNNATLAAAYHRNLEEATDEDLASLLAELKYLATQSDNQANSANE